MLLVKAAIPRRRTFHQAPTLIGCYFLKNSFRPHNLCRLHITFKALCLKANRVER